MAGNIKGIIVEIGGDTSGLQKALQNVNKITASLSKELKQVNSALKFDPKNATLLNQKQEILNETLRVSKQRLEELEKHLKDVEASGVLRTEEQEKHYRALQREIEKERKAVEDLNNELSKITNAGRNIEALGEKFTKIGSAIDNLGGKLTMRLTAPITAIAGLGITYNAQIESYTKSFENFLGSATEAEKTINSIKNSAAKSPFDTASLIRANQMLISTGENAEDAQKTILALGDAITATGGGNDELTRMASNLQQVKNAGKATAMDIRQFAYAGIDVYGLLADYTGKTTQQVKDMEVSYEDLSGALQKAASQGGKYYNAMSSASTTLNGQINQLKAEVKDTIGDLTKSLMPIAKKVVARIKEIVSNFNKLSDSQKENIVRIAGLVAAVGPLLKIGGSAITILGGTTKALGTTVKAIGLLKNGIGTATGPAANLAKALKGLASPAGMATVAVGALAAGVAAGVAYMKQKEKAVQEATKGTKQYADSIRQETEAITSEMQAIKDVQRAREENLQSQLSEIDHTQRLYNELTKITDENGRIKDGYEGRANFIISELSKALGIEITATDGVIDKYKELTGEMDTLIQKKRAEIILNSKEEAYAEALKNREQITYELIDAEEKQLKVKKELEKAERNLQATASVYGANSKEADIAAQNYSNLSDAYNEASKAVTELRNQSEKYTNSIADYSHAVELYQKGTVESLGELVNSVTRTYQKNGETVETSLKQQILLQQKYLKQGDEDAKDALASLSETLLSMTSTTTENTDDIYKAWATVASGSAEIYEQALSKCDDEQREAITQMVNTVNQMTPEYNESTSKLINGALTYMKLSPQFKTVALENMAGYLNGLNDTQLGQLLYDAGISDTEKVMKGIREGNLAEKEGMQILQSLKAGLDNGSLKASLFNTVRGLTSSLSSLFKIKASVDTSIPGHKSGLDYVPYDNYLARLHKGERVLTAEENKKLMDLQKATNLNTSAINSNIKNNSGANFVTPNIVFNVQKMDEANLQACFNYINRKFGSAY